MSENSGRTPPFLPFVIVDVLFLAMAGVILALSHRPMVWWEAGLMVACGAAAAWSLTAPVLRRDGHDQALAQSTRLADVAAELQKLEKLAAHIHAATAQWTSIETHSAQAVENAAQLSQSFSAETRAFAQILQKSNDNEKAHLRLEVEKLRRGEAEWLQTMTRVMDHVFALFQAAQRTGQRSLIDQIGLFQETCREAVRRIGLGPVLPRLGEPYDPRAHQLIDNATPPEKALVAEIVATGFTFQGQLVRRAFVSVQAAPSESSQQDDLALAQETKP